MNLSRRDFSLHSSVALGTLSHASARHRRSVASPPPTHRVPSEHVGFWTGRGGTSDAGLPVMVSVVVERSFATRDRSPAQSQQISEAYDCPLNTHHHCRTLRTLVPTLTSKHRASHVPTLQRTQPPPPRPIPQAYAEDLRHDLSAKAGTRRQQKYYARAHSARFVRSEREHRAIAT